MAYGTPTDPVAGTVITVAYAVSNILDPIRWLRQLTGNADPPGSSYVVVSSSTTGTAWSRVTTDALNDGAVTTAKLADGAITTAKYAAASIDAAAIGAGQVSTAKYADLSITAGKLAADSVTTAKLLDANVTTAKLADASVTTGKLADASATEAKIADGAITLNKIADGNITTSKFAVGCVDSAAIGAGQVGTSELLDGAVTFVKLASGISRIASGTYTGTGVTSARQITTGWAVKLVVIHDSANDTMYVAVNTTNSIRLGPSPNFVQGSSSVHVHASDGFTVGAGTAQGNVTSNTYSYTAFG